jgi:hypothetical protein
MINPRQFIKESFELDLPIQGGWGYSKDDCVVIDMNDSTENEAVPFNGIRIEKVFVEKRIYTELIVLAQDEDILIGIEWDLQAQKLWKDDGKSFEILTYMVSGFHKNDWIQLKAEYEAIKGVGLTSLAKEAYRCKRNDLMVRCIQEFWFDITSFFNHENIETNVINEKY